GSMSHRRRSVGATPSADCGRSFDNDRRLNSSLKEHHEGTLRPRRSQVFQPAVGLIRKHGFSAYLDRRLRGKATRYRHDDNYMGDGVLIYFSYPQAHENDAERAVRAGLTLVDTVAGPGHSGAA